MEPNMSALLMLMAVLQCILLALVGWLVWHLRHAEVVIEEETQTAITEQEFVDTMDIPALCLLIKNHPEEFAEYCGDEEEARAMLQTLMEWDGLLSGDIIEP